jgi:hypothetical protein
LFEVQLTQEGVLENLLFGLFLIEKGALLKKELEQR